MRLCFTIPLNPVTKKNSEQRTKSGATIASKAYRQYEKDALKVIPPFARKRINYPVNVKATYYTKIDYYAEGRKARIDLQNLHNALADTLVEAKVLEDDNCRIVYSMDGSCVKHDKIHPPDRGGDHKERTGRREMRIKEITYQHRRDFTAFYECEGCGHVVERHGYDDANFHANVIPAMRCQKCGKTGAECGAEYRPLTTKYPEGVQV